MIEKNSNNQYKSLSDKKVNNIEIITVATHSEGFFDELIHNKYNIDIKVLGYGQKWTGYKMKFELLYKYIETLPDDYIIIFVDGFDSKMNGDINKAKEIFIQNNYKVLFSSFKRYSKMQDFFFKNIYCNCNDNHLKNKSNYQIANTGLYMGYVKYLKIIYKHLLTNNYSCKEDQVLLNSICKYYDFIEIDKNEQIFYNVNINKTNINEQNIEAIFIQYPLHKPGLNFYNKIKFYLHIYLQFFIKYIFILNIIIFLFIKNDKILFSIFMINIYIFLNIDLSCV